VSRIRAINQISIYLLVVYDGSQKQGPSPGDSFLLCYIIIKWDLKVTNLVMASESEPEERRGGRAKTNLSEPPAPNLAANSAPKARGRPFEKGNTVSKGRPSGSRNKASLAADSLLEGEAEDLTRKCIELANAGDTTALRLCMERIAPVRKGRPVNVNLPPIATAGDVLGAIGATIEAMSQGDLTPDEASVIAGVLEIKRKAIETVDLEARLSAVEAGLSRDGKR
jgi:hypothetical protein